MISERPKVSFASVRKGHLLRAEKEEGGFFNVFLLNPSIQRALRLFKRTGFSNSTNSLLPGSSSSSVNKKGG